MFRKTFTYVFIAAVIIHSGPLFAQESTAKPEEIWFGTLDVKVAKLRLEIRLNENDDQSYSGKMISLDQGAQEIPFSSVTYSDKELAFAIKGLGLKYSGSLNAEKNEAIGTFEQGAARFPLTIKKVDKILELKHTQTWTGKMTAGPQVFDFQFRVFEDNDGEVSLKLDSFTENLSDIQCTMKHEGDQITINVPIAVAPAEFIGTLSEDQKTCIGKWTQRGNSFDLVLKNIPLESTRIVGQNRPQLPQPPFDYDSEDVKIENKKDNVTLAGTLTSPKGAGPFPVVVMISGSGAQDRDETIMRHKPFLVIADQLAKHGIAVLRFDDRGTAESTGDFGAATSEDFANDVEAVVDFLKTHDKVNPDKIALCGHSEGGIIAPMIASRRDDIAAIVLLAGTGVNGRQISVNQSRLLMEASGVPEYMIQLQTTMLNGLYDRKDQGGAFDEDFQNRLNEEMKACLPEDSRESFDGRPMITLAIRQIDTPWFSFFAKYDPAPALKATKCSVLAIVGEKDAQVDPKLNMPVIEQSLKDGGNKDYKLEVLPNLNHLFQNCNTGAVGEYAMIEETFSPVALDLITEWLEKRLK